MERTQRSRMNVDDLLRSPASVETSGEMQMNRDEALTPLGNTKLSREWEVMTLGMEPQSHHRVQEPALSPGMKKQEQL